VAATKPEAGLGQLKGVRLDKLGPLLGQVHTAAITRSRAKCRTSRPGEPGRHRGELHA